MSSAVGLPAGERETEERERKKERETGEGVEEEKNMGGGLVM